MVLINRTLAKLKNNFKKIPGIRYIGWFRSSKIVWPLKFRMTECKIRLVRFMKILGYNTENDKQLEGLRDVHKGETCVIIGNGPSLRIDDLERLKDNNFISFGCNRINQLFSKTTWRPSYYCLSDYTPFTAVDLDFDGKGLIKDIYEADIKRIFYINEMKKYLDKRMKKDRRILFFRMGLVPPYSVKMKPFSEDISISISDLGTVAGACIQIAAYMGFKNIYLYGIDNSYNKYLGSDGQYHIEHDVDDYADGISNISPNRSDILPKNEYQAAVQGGFSDIRKFELGFGICRDYTKEKGICIYNATRGGKLEIFERRDFDDLFTVTGNER